MRASQDITRKDMDAEEVRVVGSDPEKDMEAYSTAQNNGDIVDWEGPEDPEFPMNWSNIRKFKNISVICYCTFLT